MSDQHQDAASDLILGRRLAEKDREAFRLLVDRYETPLFRFIRSRASSAGQTNGDVEDVLQETFLSLWRRGSNAEDPAIEAPRAWLYQVARNAMLRRQRRRKNEPREFEDLESLDHLGVAAGWGSVAPNPEQWVAVRESKAAVRAAMSQLHSVDQELLYLRDIEGLTSAEVATVTGCSTAAAKSRIHRARLRLLKELRGGV